MKPLTKPVAAELICFLIRLIRGQRVILDADLAGIYGVETRVLVQAVKRNANRFPPDFLFQLVLDEAAALRSQIVISKARRGGRRYAPYAFTEHGALMAATILNSPRAVALSLYIIRAFVKLREDQVANAAILKRLAEIDKTMLLHDGKSHFAAPTSATPTAPPHSRPPKNCQKGAVRAKLPGCGYLGRFAFTIS